MQNFINPAEFLIKLAVKSSVVEKKSLVQLSNKLTHKKLEKFKIKKD